jgi:hypothetical protein
LKIWAGGEVGRELEEDREREGEEEEEGEVTREKEKEKEKEEGEEEREAIDREEDSGPLPAHGAQGRYGGGMALGV